MNQKIEGFYAVCKHKGLTGTQGVMIPSLNKTDLMLRRDVVEDIKAGKFHIYAVDTIDQGIEVLMDVKPGRRKKDGKFEKDSLHALVDQRLRQFHEQLKEAEVSNDKDGPDKP